MANMLKSYGLDFLAETDDGMMGLARYTAAEGKGIKGYYGLPYLFLSAGNAEFWESTERNDNSTLSVSAFHTHCCSSNVWELVVSDIDLSPKSMPKTERILIMNRGEDGGGMLPVDIINADVLPSFLKGDRISLQVVAPCLDVKYYASEDDCAEAVPADERGKKWMIENGALMPIPFLANHQVSHYEEGKEYDDDYYVAFMATVKSLYHGTIEIDSMKENTFIRCVADTHFGELQFLHSIDQVPENQRDNIHLGAVICGVCIISADAAIREYENGIVKDFDHNLALLRYTLQKGEAERLRSVLAEDACYETETYEDQFFGPDEIIDRFDYVQNNRESEYIAYFAELTQEDDIDLEYPAGTRCIVLADGKEPDRYESVVFMDVDDDGNIQRIKVSIDSRYRFRVDKPKRAKTLLDDVKIPESVVQPIITRARFHGLIEGGLTEEQIMDDPDYRAHEQNAQIMLDALQDAPQPDAVKAIENVFGYLFAKAIEQTINENKDNPTYEMRLTASYNPGDAFRGELSSSLSPKEHELLKSEMELGKQFANDLWCYLEMTAAGDDVFVDTFKQAAVVVQQIGQIYAMTGFQKRVEDA